MNEEKKVYYTYVVVYILNFLSATLYTTYTNFNFFLFLKVVRNHYKLLFRRMKAIWFIVLLGKVGKVD